MVSREETMPFSEAADNPKISGSNPEGQMDVAAGEAKGRAEREPGSIER
jgi:hypothetical protein